MPLLKISEEVTAFRPIEIIVSGTDRNPKLGPCVGYNSECIHIMVRWFTKVVAQSIHTVFHRNHCVTSIACPFGQGLPGKRMVLSIGPIINHLPSLTVHKGCRENQDHHHSRIRLVTTMEAVFEFQRQITFIRQRLCLMNLGIGSGERQELSKT